jgi:hypothetical protein
MLLRLRTWTDIVLKLDYNSRAESGGQARGSKDLALYEGGTVATVPEKVYNTPSVSSTSLASTGLAFGNWFMPTNWFLAIMFVDIELFDELFKMHLPTAICSV